MFGLGVQELIFIFVLALLIFGPKRLPELGRTIGSGMAEFRKASSDLQRTINAELALDEQPLPPALRQTNRLLDALVTARTAAAPAESAAPATPPTPALSPVREIVEETVPPVAEEPVEPR